MIYHTWQRTLSLRQQILLCIVVCELQMMIGNAEYQCSCVRYVLCVVVCVLQVMIGNAEYQCSCVRYLSQDNIALIVGLSGGLGLLLIVVIISAVLYRRRQNNTTPGLQEKVSENKYETFTGQDNVEVQYNRQLPDDYNGEDMSTEQHEDDKHYSKHLPNDHTEESDV